MKKVFICRVLLIIYILVLLWLTIISRPPHSDPLGQIFSGWIIYYKYHRWYLQTLYNFFMMIPFTFLLYSSYSQIAQKFPLKRAIAVSLLFSLIIELSQAVFSVGTFQLSDMVDNSLSGMIGAWIYLRFQKRKP